MKKFGSLMSAARFARQKRKQKFTVGLVVGSFDVVHLGHAHLFRYAKRHVDFLIVGLDNDETIKQVKGSNRPVHTAVNRAMFLAEFETIDKIFVIEKVSHHDSEEAGLGYEYLLKTIQPTHVFTHKECDLHWMKKQKLAQSLGIKILFEPKGTVTHSGTILDKLQS